MRVMKIAIIEEKITCIFLGGQGRHLHIPYESSKKAYYFLIIVQGHNDLVQKVCLCYVARGCSLDQMGRKSF